MSSLAQDRWYHLDLTIPCPTCFAKKGEHCHKKPPKNSCLGRRIKRLLLEKETT